MADDSAREDCNRLERMASDRATTEALWQEIRDVVLPLAGPATGMETPGTKSHGKVFDGTGEQANEMCAAGIYGLMTNPATRWSKLSTGDDALDQDWACAVWLEAATNWLMRVFSHARGGFPRIQHEFNLSLCSFGTAHKYIWPDEANRNLIRFKHCPTTSVYIAENADGEVDTWFRKFDLSARAADQMFKGKAGPAVGRALEKEPDRKFTFLHVTEPNRDRRPGRSDRRNLPWASRYVCLESRTTLKRGGHHERRYVTARFTVRRDAGSSEIYGRGPGHKALADVKMLQAQTRLNLQGQQQTVAPSLMVADDSLIGPVRMTPFGLNYYRPGTGQQDPIKPILTGARPDIGEDLMQPVRDRIWEAFYRSQFLAVRQFMKQYSKPPTATEVLELKEEEMRVLGPIFGRLEAEDLEPSLSIALEMGMRLGQVPPMPDKLRAIPEFKPVFLNPVSQAQRLIDVKGITRTLEVVGPLLQGQPEIADNWDGDLVFRSVAGVFQWPAVTLRPIERVREIRTARAQEVAAQAAMAQAEQMAGMVGQVAKALPKPRAA